MRTITPTGALNAFDPQTITAMGTLASPLAVPSRADQTKEALALRIIEIAKTVTTTRG